ncbi:MULTISPECIES: hypothetical protein [Gordonia]|uniref:hypothetical protein n=1 Tax=Gordonia TaxID=2053 RepID=UPI00301B1F12
MKSSGLVVADHRAAALYQVTGNVAARIDTGTPAEHAGVLTLPAGDGWAFADDLRGELVVHGDGRRHAIPIAIPAEHIACDPSGRYVAVTTGTGADPEPWSDLVTVVDLRSDEVARVRCRTGEPGVTIVPDQSTGRLHVVLRHRAPGAVEAIPLDDILGAGPHVPVVRGAIIDDIAHDGHGDVVDPRSGLIGVATGRGLERFVVERGVPRAIGLVEWPVPGRSYYLRSDSEDGVALGVVRGGPPDPSSWIDWTNHLVAVDLQNGGIDVLSLPGGMAFRFGEGGRRAAVATIHPDGDTLTSVRRDSAGFCTAETLDLPPLSNPPTPGRVPWDVSGAGPAQRRSVAVDPTGTWIAVTRGGDGEIHLIDDRTMTTVSVPTDLDEGGQVFWPGGRSDLIGR